MNTPKRTLLDYAEELANLTEIPSFGIIGGMAVQAWAARYLSTEEIRTTGAEIPLTSKDMDGRGNKGHALMIRGLWAEHSKHHALTTITWKETGKLAWAVREDIRDHQSKTLEVTSYVPGLDTPNKQNGYHLQIQHHHLRISVLDPISCLIAKLHVLTKTEERNLTGERNDIAHSRVLQLCIPKYIEELKRTNPEKPDPTTEELRSHAALRTALEILDRFPRDPHR